MGNFEKGGLESRSFVADANNSLGIAANRSECCDYVSDIYKSCDFVVKANRSLDIVVNGIVSRNFVTNTKTSPAVLGGSNFDSLKKAIIQVFKM